MKQITEQLKLLLIGGWYQSDIGFKKQYRKKDYGKRPVTPDWVEWLYVKLTTEINAYYVAWKSRAEFARGTGIVRMDVLSIPVTRRAWKDRHWLTMYHIHKAAARLAKRQYKYRAKKHAWVFN